MWKHPGIINGIDIATGVTLSFTPWSFNWDQYVVSVLLISDGIGDISDFLMWNHSIFLDW